MSKPLRHHRGSICIIFYVVFAMFNIYGLHGQRAWCMCTLHTCSRLSAILQKWYPKMLLPYMRNCTFHTRKTSISCVWSERVKIAAAANNAFRSRRVKKINSIETAQLDSVFWQSCLGRRETRSIFRRSENAFRSRRVKKTQVSSPGLKGHSRNQETCGRI